MVHNLDSGLPLPPIRDGAPWAHSAGAVWGGEALKCKNCSALSVAVWKSRYELSQIGNLAEFIESENWNELNDLTFGPGSYCRAVHPFWETQCNTAMMMHTSAGVTQKPLSRYIPAHQKLGYNPWVGHDLQIGKLWINPLVMGLEMNLQTLQYKTSVTCSECLTPQQPDCCTVCEFSHKL